MFSFSTRRSKSTNGNGNPNKNPIKESFNSNIFGDKKVKTAKYEKHRNTIQAK